MSLVILPSHLRIYILSFHECFAMRNGKLMNRIHPEDIRYAMLCRIPMIDYNEDTNSADVFLEIHEDKAIMLVAVCHGSEEYPEIQCQILGLEPYRFISGDIHYIK